MIIYSRDNRAKKSIEDRTYVLKKWSTVSTMFEGKRIGLAIAPSLTTIADMKLAKSQDVLSELDEQEQVSFILTAAITQLAGNFSDELFHDTVNKLLSGISMDGDVIEDWSAHFDKYPEDFMEILVWSIK
ncbi:MAG: hypothetical protein GY787_01600, partial [Alteromonadales bacterium]|nr:hypothetical protein [Alteromonadales bacterium]